MDLKLFSLREIITKLTREGIGTLEEGRRYGDDIVGSFYIEQENDIYVVDEAARLAVEENVVTCNTGIDYVLSHVKDRAPFDREFESYMTVVNLRTKETTSRMNPLKRGKTCFATAFGNGDYNDMRFSKGKYLEFQGLSNIIEDSFWQALCDLAERKAYSLVFLSDCLVASGSALKFIEFKQRFQYDLSNLYDRHGWGSATEFGVDTEESMCGFDDDRKIVMNLDREAISSMFNANIMCGDLRLSGKKLLVGGVTEVPFSEVEEAAKKIKTVTDINGLKMYKIDRGLVISNSQEVNDYWRWRRRTIEEMQKCVSSVEGYYVAVMDTPENSFKTVGTTLGRTISSCSKQLTNKVMESLDLDNLI